MTLELISRGRRTTLTGCMGPSLLKWSKEKMMKKNKEMKLKTVSPGFRNAQWQAVLYLPKSGRYSTKFGQVRDLTIHCHKSSWTL
jgi:hypothetical protein